MLKAAKLIWIVGLSGIIMACHANQNKATEAQNPQESTVKNVNSKAQEQRYQVEKIALFNEPWAIATLPNGQLLITEKSGILKLFDSQSKRSFNVAGVPQVAYGGQGGLGDVSIHPNFNNNAWLYLSYAEEKNGLFGAVVIRAKLDLSNIEAPKLTDIERIWEQVPKVSGQGHYAHRIVFDQQANLWISSGERQKFQPAQDMQSNLGKIVYLYDDGRAQESNPFAKQGGVSAQIWSLGHRNPLGMAFDHQNRLWVAEMGPKGGDEFNLIEKGKNYGYPIVSNGDHYDGKQIPNHETRPEFIAPKLDWSPVISPSSLIFYKSNYFPQWKNKALIGGLSSKAIIVVDPQSEPVREIQRLDMGVRVRDLHEAKDGTIWGIEDGPQAYLFKLKAKLESE